jgi:hypothetical protein
MGNFAKQQEEHKEAKEREKLSRETLGKFFYDLGSLGDFLVLFAPVLRQIARYLPHHRSENASKTHPKSSHDKFKTASKIIK